MARGCPHRPFLPEIGRAWIREGSSHLGFLRNPGRPGFAELSHLGFVRLRRGRAWFEFEFGWVRSDSRELSGSFGFGSADRPRQRRERVHQRLRHPARRHAQRIPGQARRCAGSPRHPHDGRQRPRAARPTLDMARFLAGCWRLAGANREAPDGLAQLTSLTHDRNIVHTAPRRHHAHRLAAGLSDGTAPCRKADMLRNRVTRLVVTL